MVTVEKRAPRCKFHGPVAIEWGGTVLPGRVSTINANGMFIEMPNPPWLGAAFATQLPLEVPLQVSCEVRYVEPGRGIGVSIVVSDEMDRKRFAAFLDSLDLE